MPQPKNHLLRALVPLVVAVAGVGVAIAVFRVSKPSSAPVAAPSVASAQPPADPLAGQPSQTPATAQSQPTSPITAAPPPVPTTPSLPPPTPAEVAYRARIFPPLVPADTLPPIGDLDPKGRFEAQVKFSNTGAGIALIELADHFETIKEDKHVTVQSEHSISRGPYADVLSPFAALAIELTPAGASPVMINLAAAPSGPVWRLVSATQQEAAFEAIIEDGMGADVLRIQRTYALAPGAFELSLNQRLTNLSARPLTIRWFQVGPVDLPQDAASYGGDKRHIRFGYLLSAAKDPTQGYVVSDKYILSREEVLGKRETVAGADGLPLKDASGNPILRYPEKTAWPNQRSIDDGYSLVWSGMSNRYFGVTVHPQVAPGATGVAKTFAWVQGVSRVVLDNPGQEVLALRLESKPLALGPAGAAGAVAELPQGIFVGPLDRRLINAQPTLKALGLSGLVVYNFGGMCAPCTFGFLTDALLWLLHTLHDFIFHDWSLAIIFLVVCVRTLLHPVTKWSQIRMARFGKQMQAVGPKQKLLQEKFKGDPKKLQEETAKLWREEGINPAQMLGCVPMLLQTPIWIALFATLYFAVELRHQHAFYGVFQMISSGIWFLGDLAEPDRLYYFGRTIASIPLLGPITSINILPVILGIVFFIQQKYLTPPTSATMTPEQEMQQKMVKWMMVFMFPVMMYNAPSGLALYFIANSTIAILESRYIRSHMDKYGMLDTEKMKSERLAKINSRSQAGTGAKQQGFFARMQDLAEQKRNEMMKSQGKRPNPNRRK